MRMKIMYLIIMTTVMLNLTTCSLIFLSYSVLMNLIVLPSPLSVKGIRTKMLIRNRQKKKPFKKLIVTLSGNTDQRVSNKCFCGSYFNPKICQNILIISYFNQCSRCFITSKLNFHLLKMRRQKIQFNAIVATKQ